MVMFAIVLSPMLLIGLYNILRFGSFAVGAILIGIPLLIWAYGNATVRIIATEQIVEMRRLFWRVWRLEIDKVMIREGAGGDIPILPAYVLEQRSSSARGTIVRLLFSKERLEELLNFLVAHGAVLCTSRKGG